MNKQKLLILITVLVLIASTAGVLARYTGNQKLGPPGVRTRPLPGTANLEVLLPERVLDYTSEILPHGQVVFDLLPKDTSFGQRIYRLADPRRWIQLSAVLMGADRTSLHKPEVCMPGQGFTIGKTEIIQIPIARPHAYTLPALKMTVSKPVPEAPGGVAHGMFIYWYVADGVVSADASAIRRMWLSTKYLFLNNELQRWAYIGCFSTYAPGEEAACLDRMQQFLADAIPQFQTATGSARPGSTPAASQ